MIVILVVIMVFGVVVIFLSVLSSICYMWVIMCIGSFLVMVWLWVCLLGEIVGLLVDFGVIFIIEI